MKLYLKLCLMQKQFINVFILFHLPFGNYGSTVTVNHSCHQPPPNPHTLVTPRTQNWQVLVDLKKLYLS